MTRVILTNKQTGQELPEANLVNVAPSAYMIQFDGTGTNNSFYREEWDYREVRQFRNGDVLRRKDRDNEIYIHFDGGWHEAAFSSYSAPVNDILADPEWEVA